MSPSELQNVHRSPSRHDQVDTNRRHAEAHESCKIHELLSTQKAHKAVEAHHQITDHETPILLRCPALFWIQQVIRLTKDQEMRKQGIEMPFQRQMDDLTEMGVVEMGEDAEELRVQVSRGQGEHVAEFSA